MKVAIVHDDLVQWGGAERVLTGICELFPDAPIYTSLVNFDNPKLKNHFKDKKIQTSFIQKIPFWKKLYRSLLPFYPLAFEQFDFSGFDLVISQTTRFSKSVLTKPETKHLCYCHTPPRFLWNFTQSPTGFFLAPYFSYLRCYDQISSQRVDSFIAGSENTKIRIQKIYQRESQVCLPFVDLSIREFFEPFDGGYYLLISRLVSFKKVEIAVKAFNKLGKKFKIVGQGPELGKLEAIAKDNIEFLGFVSDLLLFNLLAGCCGLIVVSEEDFGLTPLEAQVFGKGVIAFGLGGVRETVLENETGVFFDKQEGESLEEAVDRFEKLKINSQDCVDNAQRFSKVNFQKRFRNLVETSID